MGYIQEYSATITTAAGGTATVYVGSAIRGRVHAIRFVIGTLTNTIDLVITGETTGIAILTDSPADSEVFYPRAFANKVTDGAAATTADQDVYVINERIKVVAAQGGDTKTGTIYVQIEESEH